MGGAMDEHKARTRWQALLRMTVARGCSVHEAEVAARLAGVLAKRWGFADTPTQPFRPDFDDRFSRAQSKAAQRFNWEYRKCGKANCHCFAGGRQRHGPYKYGKVRRGHKVNSIYLGG